MKRLAISVLFLGMISHWAVLHGAKANESLACGVQSSELSCGGQTVKDAGCSVSCPEHVGYEPICRASECHALPLDHSFDYLCALPDGTNGCVLGNDGAQWIVIHSACFCD